MSIENIFYIRDLCHDATVSYPIIKPYKILCSANFLGLSPQEQLKLCENFRIQRIIALDHDIHRAHTHLPQIFAFALLELIDLDLSDISSLSAKLCAWPTIIDTKAKMIAGYEKILLSAKGIMQLQQIFAILKQECEGATLITSRYGIHHTSIVAALLLEALGLDHKFIINSYLQCNHEHHQKLNELIRYLGKNNIPIENIQKLPYIFGTDLTYISTVFSSIEKQYQSIANYRLQALKLDDNIINQLRDIYL